ncbi:hypothetical protein BGZ94_003928 [Podila epigama]|nr:hypothetical protein BGZ94_003928 [Podila epigama]
MTPTVPVLQRFYGKGLRSNVVELPTLVCPESGRRYIPWHDIASAFENIDHLSFQSHRIPFMTDKAYNVIEPLRIAYRPEAFRVNFKRLKKGATTMARAETFLKTTENYVLVLTNNLDKGRPDVLEVTANVRYWHSKLRAELDDLEKAGALTADHYTIKDEMLDELMHLEESVKESDYKNVCYHTLCQVESDFATPGPRTLVVLPSDLESWDESDPDTHSFRCHFLCEWNSDSNLWKEDWLPSHYHLADHPGYDLLRPQEFFQRYGDYALRVLRVIQSGRSGHSESDFIVPPLETFEILSGHTSSTSEKRLCKDTLAQLVSKSISYLEKLGLPEKERLGLVHQEIRGIKEYLDIEHGEEGLGDLFRYIKGDASSWVCRKHFQQMAKMYPIDEMRQFVDNDCGGTMDVHRGVIQVTLSSESMAREFATCINRCNNSFEVSIKLTWPATRKFLKEISFSLWTEQVKWLELDGVTVEVYPEEFVEHESDLFVSNQRYLTLLNYPRLGEQCTKVDKICFQSPMPEQHEQGSFCWIRGALLEKWTSELNNETYGAKEESGNEENYLQKAIQMMAAITGDNLPQVSWTGTIDDDMVELLDLKSGAIDLRLNNDIVPSYPSAKSRFLRQLTIEASVPVFEPEFVSLVQRLPRLEELNAATQGKCPVGLAEYLIETCRHGSRPLLITLFERSMDEDERGWIVVQMAIDAPFFLGNDSPNLTGADNDRGNGTSMVQSRSYLEGSECRKWNNDVAMIPSTLEQALLLDRWTTAFPESLKFFTLNIAGRSMETLVAVQSILRRSRLSHLHIPCEPIEFSLQEAVRQVLESIEWSSIQLLVLVGECIEPWVEQLATIYEHGDSNTLPLYLMIEDNDLSPNPLSHSGALALHQLVYSRSLDDVQLRNIQFQDEKDRLFVMDSFKANENVVECNDVDPKIEANDHDLISHVQVSGYPPGDRLGTTMAQTRLLITQSTEAI